MTKPLTAWPFRTTIPQVVPGGAPVIPSGAEALVRLIVTGLMAMSWRITSSTVLAGYRTFRCEKH